MAQSTDIGKNRTGISMAPLLGEAMVHGAEGSIPSSSGDGEQLSRLRQQYARDAPPVGSTPPPLSIKGAVKAGVRMLAGDRPSVFIDKLGERIAFERTGTRLYEALLAKLDAAGTWNGSPEREEISEFHQEELKHFHWLCEAAASMGVDPTVLTPSADIAGITSAGVIQVITDPRTSLAESLHALLVAELADNDGWRLLIHLAEMIREDDLARRFRIALGDEDKHLQTVRRWINVAVDRDVKRLPEEEPLVH